MNLCWHEKPYKKIKGFTLIELLIVIVIISIVASFALLSIRTNESKRLETLTGQLVRMLTLAEQEALLRPATIGFALRENQLRFYEYRATQDAEKSPWILLNDSILNTLHIPSDVQITMKTEEEKTPQTSPEIIITSNGITPFILLIGKKNAAPLYKIVATENGNLKSGVVDEENQ
jgi:type II secretion system protein H